MSIHDLDFCVEKEAVAGQKHEFVDIYYTYRTDTGKTLGIVGPEYRVAQNSARLEALQERFGNPAASRVFGAKVIALYIGEVVNGFELVPVGMWSHDGSVKFKTGVYIKDVESGCMLTPIFTPNRGEWELMKMTNLFEAGENMEPVQGFVKAVFKQKDSRDSYLARKLGPDTHFFGQYQNVCKHIYYNRSKYREHEVWFGSGQKLLARAHKLYTTQFV
jgi:hypothetical protein